MAFVGGGLRINGTHTHTHIKRIHVCACVLERKTLKNRMRQDVLCDEIVTLKDVVTPKSSGSKA